MIRHSTHLISLLATIVAVLGCGAIPQAMTRNFAVSGLKLPTAMVFTTSVTAPAQIPGGIAATSNGVKSFVSRLVMQTINDVLEQQGRSAGLPDAIISNILNQLMVQISYDPLECKTVTVGIPADNMIAGVMAMNQPHCIVVVNTVTALCAAPNGVMCDIGMGTMVATIPPMHLSISGSITTTNIIMATWSRDMWQGVVNRAVRMLASGPLTSHFFSAFATVS